MTNLKCLLLANLFIFSTVAAFSQVKIVTNGKTTIGNYRPGNDYNNEVTQEFMGLGNDPYRVGGKIAIGDYGSGQNGSANVFIAEAYGWDSDALEIHGKNGIYFSVNGTSGAAGTILGAQLNGYGDLDVTHTVSALSYITRSDERIELAGETSGNNLMFSRIYYSNGKFTAFTTSSLSSDAIRLEIYKTAFFNSISFAQP
jgi:hypothetical protein